MIFNERKYNDNIIPLLFFKNALKSFSRLITPHRYWRILIVRKLTPISSSHPSSDCKCPSFGLLRRISHRIHIHFAVKLRARADHIFLRLIVSFHSTRTWKDRKCFEGKGGKKVVTQYFGDSLFLIKM